MKWITIILFFFQTLFIVAQEPKVNNDVYYSREYIKQIMFKVKFNQKILSGDLKSFISFVKTNKIKKMGDMGYDAIHTASSNIESLPIHLRQR